MIKRGLALGLVLGVASFANAGAVIDLRPDATPSPFNPNCEFVAGAQVTVEVFLTQSGGSDRELRLVQLGFSGTDAAIGLPTDVSWEVTSEDHFVEDEIGGQRPDLVAIAYTGPIDPINPDATPLTALGPDAARQLTLPGTGEIKVAQFDITLPAAAGSYELNVLTGAEVHFGFSLPGFDPITAWKATQAAPDDVTGGSFTFDVAAQNVTAVSPNDQGSLFRSNGNEIVLTFNTNIGVAGPIANPGVEINQLQNGGVLGADLSGNFSFAVENDGGNPRILRITETTASLSHLSWYTVRNTGAFGAVAPFRVQHKVLVGDVDGDGLLLSGDAGLINNAIPCFFACDPSLDVDGDGLILSGDAGLANNGIPVFFVPKPAGHDCP